MTEQPQARRGDSFASPDPAGIVRRGAAVSFKGYVEEYGEPPMCFVGGEPGESCERPTVMEVYGLPMCEVHGEEAASGALEIAHDLEQELQRPLNIHVKALSPHLACALRHGFEILPEGIGDYERDAALLVEAFPLDRDRVCGGTLDYVRDPDGNGRGHRAAPFDSYLDDRMLLCRHMRLAFEEGADWLVEVLERELVAAQAAYAYVLDPNARLRS